MAAASSWIAYGTEAAAMGKLSESPKALHFLRSSVSMNSRNTSSSIWGRMIKTPALSPKSSVRRLVTAQSGQRHISGKCFIVGDNIDTDQIIPAEYLTLVPSKPDEYEKLGSYAMVGLPPKYGKFIEDGKMKTKYSIIIAGANFGCGSSREHAPVALGAAGVQAVVAESYARIFFRNSVATGEIYPAESEARICEEFNNGDDVTYDMEHDLLINKSTGKQYTLKPLGDAGPVIDAGGIFAYARQTGMIPSPAS